MAGPKSNSNNGSSSSSSNNMTHGVPKTGRELAIEALIDLDDRGPSFRVNRILSEVPKVASTSRPNKISRAALFDVAQCLSKHQIPTSDYLRYSNSHSHSYLHQPSLNADSDVEVDADADADAGVDTNANANADATKEKEELEAEAENASRVLFKDPATPGADAVANVNTDGASNPDSENKSRPRLPTEKERERVMKHFAKIILANQNIDSTSTGQSQNSSGDLQDQDEGKSSDEANNEDRAMEDAKLATETETETSCATSTSNTITKIHDSPMSPSPSLPSIQSVCASPPPQLVAALRKIYGTHSSERLDELDDSDGSSGSGSASNMASSGTSSGGGSTSASASTAVSTLLPSLIQSIVGHDIFSKPIQIHPMDDGSDANDVNAFASVGALATDTSESIDASNESNTNKDEDKKDSTVSEDESRTKEDHEKDKEEQKEQDSAKGPPKPSPIHSPICNLEALIGNACNFNPNDNDIGKNSDDHKDGDEILLGILIAAFAVLTSCITSSETTADDEIAPMDDDNSQKLSSSSRSTSRNSNDSIISTTSSQTLQVAGPLSLHAFHVNNILSKLEKSTASTNDAFEKLHLDPALMNYFMEAASVYMERDEIQRANDMLKVKGVSASVSLSVSVADDLGDDKEQKKITDAKEGKGGGTEEADSDDKRENESSDASRDKDTEMDPEQGQNEQTFSEPHGYSFAEDDEDDDSSQDDDEEEEEDDSSSSSDDERPMLIEPKEEDSNENEVSVEAKDDDSKKSEDDENKNDGQNSSQDADKCQVENEGESLHDNSLHQAIALSLTENLQDLPQLPSYPDKNSQPEDVATLNPASFSGFGKLPPSNVFINLLHIALERLENKRIGNASHNTTIHVMVAILHVLSNARIETIRGLSDLVKKLKECDGQYKTDENVDETMEDDDPAFAASPLAASAYSSSESLEEKGMMRKAAAAAHSASIQRAKIEQDIGSFRGRLKLYSLSSYLLMKCLRCFMQASSISPSKSEGPCQLFPLSVPTITRVRLSASLATFMSSSLSKQYYYVVTNTQCQKSIDDESLPVVLLFEAASLWGEATPLIYPSPTELESQLQRSLKQCFPTKQRDKEEYPRYDSFADIKYPWSDFDASLLKVDSMCRRLRCDEMIGNFVPSPKIYSSPTASSLPEAKTPHSSTYKKLACIYYEILPNYSEAVTKNVKALYMAFHHRYNQDLLLWKNADATYLDVPFGNDISDASKQISDSGDAKVYLMKNPSFTFDSSKCADSISLVSSQTPDVGAQSAHQRASKVWGTVLSSKMFNPKSGVHRWAVRLDKCERGHVFVGVATSRASKKTYVGGDKFSWGVIGTQALWHERRKIRSDYGNTFRSGSTVIVTLDTDAGTLGFGILHDFEQSGADESSSESVSLISPSQANGQTYDASGFVEDWGIAFEGLPLDAKLFPAVGLYQRDDKVTLLTVAKTPGIANYSSSLNDLVQGPLLYPGKLMLSASNTSEMTRIESVRRWNSSVCNEGIFFASSVLEQAIEHLMSDNSTHSNLDFFRYILPSVASSLALYPLSIPVLSGRFSMTLLPLIHKCVLLIEEKIKKQSAHLSPNEPMKSGTWTIRAAPCTSSSCAPNEYEEYVVEIDKHNGENPNGGGFEGKGIGTSGKSINCKVSIVGAYRGTCIQFAEEWRDECETSAQKLLPTSSCVIDAKMNLYGTRFEGVYKNVHYGKCGSIAGFFNAENLAKENQDETEIHLETELQQCLVRCSSLFGMAVNHLCNILSRGAPTNDVGPDMSSEEKVTKKRHMELQKFISSSPILSNGFGGTEDGLRIESCANSVISYFLTSDERVQEASVRALSYWKETSLSPLIESCKALKLGSPSLDVIHNLDTDLAPKCGGLGSLSLLEPESYRASREKIIAVLLHHTRSQRSLLKKQTESISSKEISTLWHTALQIMESGVRTSLFRTQKGSSRKRGCKQYCELADSISDFLLAIHPQESPTHRTLESVTQIYSFITSTEDISSLVEIMKSESRKGLLEYFGLSAVRKCINSDIKTLSSMESMISSWSRSDGHYRDITLQLQGRTSTMHACSKGIMSCIYRAKEEVLSILSSHAVKKFAQENQNEANTVSSVSLQSLSLMILSSYFCLAASQSQFIKKPSLWDFIKCLISSCRNDLGNRLLKEELLNAQQTPAKNASILFASMKRQTSLNILNCSSSMLHLVLFLFLNRSDLCNQEDISSLTQMPFSIFRDELHKTLDLMKQEHVTRSEKDIVSKVNNECVKWLSSVEQDSDQIIEKREQDDQENKFISTGVNFIVANVGAFIHESSSSRVSLEGVVLAYNSCEGYFVLLLNILSSLVRSKTYPNPIRDDSQWIKILLDPIIYDTDEITLPLRLRIRILRLLRFMIPVTAPDAELVTTLLNHASNLLLLPVDEKTTANTPEMECYTEAKEVISLLRCISLPNGTSKERINDWQSCVITALNNVEVKRGVHCLFGGIPDKVVVGSCVLLKPSAASTIAATSSQSSSRSSSGTNRSKSSFVSMAPVAASSGAEGIVAGLCRRDALAGRISEIDILKGTCEIVLFDRSNDLHGNTLDSMSVRAVKVPLLDVVAADEISLLIDRRSPVSKITFQPLLESLRYTTTLLEQINEENVEEKQEDFELEFTKILDTMLNLRSSAVIFSNPELLQMLLKDSQISQNDKRECFARVMQLGALPKVNDCYSYTNSACGDSLSSLPEYQARFWYLRDLLQEASQRKNALNSTPLENFFNITKKVADKDQCTETPTKNSSDENIHVTPPVSRQEYENVSTEDEISQGRRSGTDVSGFHSNSIETVNDDDEENEDQTSSSRLAEETEAAHLREAAIVQMAELGLPRSWSEYALRRVGGTNIEAAVHFCLERGGDMERLLLEEEERNRRTNSSSSRRRSGPSTTGSSHLLRQLVEMGFPPNWCAEALSSTGHNVDEALTWMIRNGERLSALDEGADNGDDDEEEEEDEECDSAAEEGQDEATPKDQSESTSKEDEQKIGGWCHDIVCPLRSISGRTNIDHKTLAITGLPTGGFSSVGMKGVPLEKGKWYYEAELITDGCLQIGWADSSFSGHCQADRGDGCGDGPSSWAFDGWRRYRWHSIATEWGCRWREGDIVGCLLDMDKKEISFTLNGRGEEIGMGLAFSGDGFRPCGGVYACVSFNRREKIRLILGGDSTESFHYPPPPGYKGVGEAVKNMVNEREELLKHEDILFNERSRENTSARQSYLCDFSDGEHGYELFAWQHRYYGSDASVHLGGRSSRTKSSTKRHCLGINTQPTTKNIDDLYKATIDAQLAKAWEKRYAHEDSDTQDLSSILEDINSGYDTVISDLMKEMNDNSLAICVLYARKFIMHVAIAMSSDFSLELFSQDNNNKDDSDIACKFWEILDKCCGLHAAGWVGEAGAMAVASEALGLAISSHDRSLNGSPFSGFLSMSSYKNGKENGERTYFPTAALSQFLSTAKVIVPEKDAEDMRFDPSLTLVSCAEASLGGDVGGTIIFIRKALQNAVITSNSMALVLLAVVRRSVRLLSSVEYGDMSPNSNDSDDDDDDEDDDGSNGPDLKASSDGVDEIHAPDARLTSFLTGLLLSTPVCKGLESSISGLSSQDIADSLFISWSVGLLSASAPWRMVCAMTVSSILDLFPLSIKALPISLSTLHNFYSRLNSTVSRRLWAERSAVPICSRYAQSFVELSCSVRKATILCDPLKNKLLGDQFSVDAATPIPLPFRKSNFSRCWEWDEAWVNCDAGWDVWTGSIEYHSVDWMTPSRSAVRSLTDGGEGPPMLREGCTVMRGLDWDDEGSGSSTGNEDGKDLYEEQKREKEIEPKDEELSEENPSPSKKKGTSPKLPVGKVIGIEPWKGIPGLARRVKWNLTDEEGLYRYGGDGGRYDIAHVEVNDKSTRVRKRHPLPESLEQCAARYGFGINRKFNVLLRLRTHGEEVCMEDEEREIRREGILEMPDFGAGILVECKFYDDGAVAITEERLLYGSKDSGWEPRFGQPSYVSGTTMVLSMTNTSLTTRLSETDSQYGELLGSSSFAVPNLRNRADGGKVRVTSEMRLLHDKAPERMSISSFEGPVCGALLPPICFDTDFHSPSLSLSRDRRTVTCIEADGRCTAFGSVGFTKGVHYWEVKIEQADTGSIFIGVAEKPSADSSSNSSQFGSEIHSRLNRWLGWGFVNFRATYSAGAERVYGAHCHAGDTIGVLLDCDAGRLSFFYDGVKYGEHIMNDLGCAYENISPFGFNADGCGSSGAGQGAPNGGSGHGRGGRYPSNGAVKPKALWPVVGMRHPGDRVTFSAKWMTSHGVDGVNMLQNVLAIDEVLTCYENSKCVSQVDANDDNPSVLNFPDRFVEESFKEFERWSDGRWLRTATRGSGPQSLSSCGLEIDIDTSPLACAAACASLGLKFALLPGDRVNVKRSAGRLLELPEDAEVLGAYQGRLWYKIISQKSEGGSLSEGGGRAWFWDESEVVDNSLQVLGESKAQGIDLPLLDKFKCCAAGGLRIVYSGGAVVRSDLEIFDGSENIGTIPDGTIIPQDDVIERRMNSCGVVRYRVKYDAVGQGWISSRIRGGKEEPIVELILSCDEGEKCEMKTDNIDSSTDSARIWFEEFNNKTSSTSTRDCKDLWSFADIDEFKECLSLGTVPSLSPLQSDSLLTSFVSSVADFSHHGDAVESSFELISSALFSTIKSHDLLHDDDSHVEFSTDLSMKSYQSAAAKFSRLSGSLPPMKCLLARVAMIRALNRRAKYALPWLSSRPSQESSAVLGGLEGFGASVERCGKSSICTPLSMWVQASSCGSRLRDCRSILFGSVKKEFLNCIISATTTPTPLSHDEYELPREVRTIRVNRVKARHAMASTDVTSKKKNSVFSQLQNETRGWSGAALRRGHVAKGHGGQKRAFKVKLIGEGVNDYSGPYREVFTDAMREVIATDETMTGALGVLDPTPNRTADIGEYRSLHMFSFPSSEEAPIPISISNDVKVSEEEVTIRKHYSSYLVHETECLREAEESVSFLGKLASTAVRHGILVDLPLPLESVWKPLCEEHNNDQKSLEELDLLKSRYHKDVNSTVPILVQQRRMLNAFTEGISSVMPVEILSIFSGTELRDFYCGSSDIDVDLLQKIVEYEGYTEKDSVIQYFWEVLREMTSEERKLFLQFVWARSRLPIKESDFEDPFKIQKDTKCSGTEVHSALPSASTCFFSLSLPQYQDKETLKRKLLFAINNVTTMESDYVTNDSEVREGWRGM